MCFVNVTILEGKYLNIRLVQATGTTLTTHVVQSTQGHVRSDVKFWSIHSLGQLLHQKFPYLELRFTIKLTQSI